MSDKKSITIKIESAVIERVERLSEKIEKQLEVVLTPNMNRDAVVAKLEIIDDYMLKIQGVAEDIKVLLGEPSYTTFRKF